jgi:tRNA(Ile2) C34 agmatinyltransferase TiaS
VSDPLVIRPEFKAVAAVRRASSSCCGAKLNAAPQGWQCRACGKPCERILSEPEEVKANG